MYIVTLYRKWIGVVERNACLVSTFHQPKICRNIILKHKLYDIALVPFRKSHTWIFWQVVTHSWSNQREPNGLIRDKFSIIQPWEKKKRITLPNVIFLEGVKKTFPSVGVSDIMLYRLNNNRNSARPQGPHSGAIIFSNKIWNFLPT